MQLTYTSEELLADHAYAKPHVVAGQTLHGGFDADGTYRSPRTRHRLDAVANWRSALRDQGGSELEIGLDLLSGPRYPNFDQQKLLLLNGIGQPLWNTFTSIGRTEAGGAALANIVPPPFEEIVDADIRETTLGHLRPLFIAHGNDEGGIPSQGIGGHDKMWFVARDQAFGEGRYPLPPVQKRAGQRPGQAESWMPDLPTGHAQLLRSLMGLLMIEVRAFIGFQQNERILRDPELFGERREEAEEAADIVARIREDERVHVAYLCNLFGELRHAKLKCTDGSTKSGAEIIDPAWQRQVHVSKDVMPPLQRADMQKALHSRIGTEPGGARLLEEFEALTDPGAFD